MRCFLPLIVALAAFLAACGGGGENAPVLPASKFKSRLSMFDANGLDAGLELPVLTRYWDLSESRNGNAYPVKAGVSDSVVLCAGLSADNAYSTLENGKFVPSTFAALTSNLDTIAQKHWNTQVGASAAALVLLADGRAPFAQLQVLCRELVNLRMANLWLATRDERDDALRLLPLFVDTTQLGKDWYELEQSEFNRTLRFTWTRGPDSEQAGLDWVSDTGLDLGARKDVVPGKWQDAMAARASGFAKNCSRVQFDLPQDATIADFAGLVNLLAPAGYSEVEPFWPALGRPEDSGTVHQVRALAEFDDTYGCAAGLNLPTLSHWWRASAADRGLAPAVEVNLASPILSLRVDSDGMFATRATGDSDWASHSSDVAVLDALRRLAGEIDFDTGLSELQVVLAMDRTATWESFLGVLEMLRSVGCFRLFVLTYDLVGPTLRLLDASLPVGDSAAESDVASVRVEREGAAGLDRYTVTMKLDGQEHRVTGARYSSSLTQWTGDRVRDPEVLGVWLPRDEPFETLFTVLNAVAWLGSPAVTFGG